ncbi:GLE1-like protein [Cantharellus anzutake]|uniref:GLE1-like protein n=1 Tax=Cantharellus anzutake TaxID=1750568 RepID=UPI00190412EC|nr:GLE1-like protein [Cantharellus anzutake]KAF8331480.1 GLE1-like protein [Cantharellus anzutake]
MPEIDKVKSAKLHPDITPNADWKKELAKLRRQIIPKIGQVTNVRIEIQRITAQLHGLLSPTPGHPEPLYIALLYVLSKAFLKQAEEEVTAKPDTAFPLAHVFVGLLEKGHFQLGNVFMAKLVQMSSHWVVGAVITRESGQSDEDYRIALGRRPESSGETTVQYIERLGGLVTLYAAILQTPYQSNLPAEQLHQIPTYVRLPRLWTWIIRLVNHPGLMADRAAPVILSCILEATGEVASAMWPRQMAKLRSVLLQKASEPEQPGSSLIGGPEGKAGRVRLKLLMEKWEKDGLRRWEPMR